MKPRPLAAALAALALSTSVVAAPSVVVLGFDGADAELTQQLMDEGRLPNLAALRAEGGFWPLLPTNPPQTPVSWSTFATGLNPGRTEIFDFIMKRDGTYLPTLCAYDERPRREVLWGTRNALLFGLAGASIALVPFLFAFAVRRWRRALVVTGLALAAVGALAGAAFSRWVPESIPAPKNNRKGDTFWEIATRAGLEARILQVPVTFPADRDERLEMLSGLGVPDVRGLNGQPTLYTTREGVTGGQFSVKVVRIEDPRRAGEPIGTTLEGPRNVLFPPRLRQALEDGPEIATVDELREHVDDRGVTDAEMEWSGFSRWLDAQGQARIRREDALAAAARQGEPRIAIPMTLTAGDGDAIVVEVGEGTSTVRPGQWSDWHLVEFPFNRLLRAKGMARFYDQSTPEAFELLVSPIHFQPEAGRLVGFCHPPGYAAHLEDEVGRFKTMGWASDTWTVSDGLSSDQQALEDIQFTTDGFEKLMESELRGDPHLFVQVFAFTDRLQHVFWRLRDPRHPGYDAELAARYDGVVERAYERMDAIVGKARALAPEAHFLVLSDHGFASFRRGVNLNRWLVNHGWMVLKRDPCAAGGDGSRSLDDLFESQGGVWSEVDWSRTRAYAMGLGNVYVNVAGREPQGVVRPGEDYDRVVTEISAGLEALVDPETGERPVVRVHHRDADYSGYDPEVVPDLRVSNSDGYRVSWDTVLGGVPCTEIADNDKAWGGDHCSLEPELVKGILFANRPLKAVSPEMADVMPTLLAALGLEPPAGLDGSSLW